MSFSRVLGQLSGRMSLLQVASGELKPCCGLASAGFVRMLSMSNNMELPSHYEVASERLATALGCSKQESCAILIEFPEIKKLKSSHMTSRCDYLTKDLGIPPQQVISFPWLLQMSRTVLEERVVVLANRTKVALSSLIPLMQFPPSKLKKMFSFSYEEDRKNVLDNVNPDRIDYLSRRLRSTPLETCNLISKHNFLLYVPLFKLEEVLNLFEDYNIDIEDVKKDIWILRYNPEQIKTRLDIVKSIGMDKAKPWLTRSTEKVFIRSIEKFTKNQELLGKSMNKMDFIQELLNLQTNQDAIDLAEKYPVLLKISPSKLKNSVQALCKAGIALEEIVAAPRALAYSSKFLLERHNMLMEKYQHKAKLSALTRTEAIFNELVNKLEAKKKSEQDIAEHLSGS